MTNDLISRQAAIDAVKKNTFRLTFAEEQNCEGHVAWSAEAVYSDVMEGALLEFPSAQPEPIKINIDDFNKEDLERVKKELGNTPITVLPAQPEIIRCKDCKHWTNNIGDSKLRDNYCNDEAHGLYYQCSEDDYCSFAERRTDE